MAVGKWVKAVLVLMMLVCVKGVSRLLYRTDFQWVGEPAAAPWDRIRLIILLNHTSLFEPLFVSVLPAGMLWRFAVHGLAPAAAKTMNRPLVGRFYSLIGSRIIPISRERDQTWQVVLDSIGPDSLVIVAAEGRMKRPGGLDRNGRPMTVRGGVADLLEGLDGGRMIIAYSGGLHHVQVPGQRWPRLFKTIRLKAEVVSIDDYEQSLRQDDSDDPFKVRVIRDLERRRDAVCPPMERLSGIQYSS